MIEYKSVSLSFNDDNTISIQMIPHLHAGTMTLTASQAEARTYTMTAQNMKEAFDKINEQLR